MRRRDLLAALSVLSGLAGCVAPPQPGALDEADREVLPRIEAYLNSIRTLRARFAQTSTQGDGSGTAWIERPGRMRLQYDPPSRVLLIAARGRVIYTDGATGGSSSLPLARTPLSILLADRIVLSGAVTVVSVRRTQGPGAAFAPDIGLPARPGDAAPRGVEVTLRSTERPGQGRLSLGFSDGPLRLRGLVLVDGRGDETRLSLSSVQVGVPAEDTLFQVRA